MEIPIRIMITLFVAITVAAVVISFSRNIITKSETDIQSINAEEPENEQIIELNSFTDSQIAALGVECYKKNHGTALVRELCFSVHDDSGKGGANPAKVAQMIQESADTPADLEVDTSNYDNSDYALRIIYDPVSESVVIGK